MRPVLLANPSNPEIRVALWVCPLGFAPLMRGRGIPLWGGNTAWERLVGGLRPPHGPPYIPIGVLVGFASRFASILGLDCM